MTRLTILVVALLFALATPVSAQHVIYNPGWCAQFYPNANCQNYGPGNPYTSYGWRGTYGYWGHRHYPRRNLAAHPSPTYRGLATSQSPSIVPPGNDQDTYLVLDSFGDGI